MNEEGVKIAEFEKGDKVPSWLMKVYPCGLTFDREVTIPLQFGVPVEIVSVQEDPSGLGKPVTIKQIVPTRPLEESETVIEGDTEDTKLPVEAEPEAVEIWGQGMVEIKRYSGEDDARTPA